MSMVERDDDEPSGALARFAGFAPPVLLTLLPALELHPALAAGPLLALPLFLLAAVQAAGYRYESSYFDALRARGAATLLLCAAACLALAALLGWPLWRLLQTGALGSVLLLSAAAAIALLGLWRSWAAFGVVFLWEEAASRGILGAASGSLSMAREILARRDGAGMRGLLSAFALLSMFSLALLLAVPLPASVDRFWLQAACALQALVLAPLASWIVVEMAARCLLDSDTSSAVEVPAELPIVALPTTSTPTGNSVERLYDAARSGRVDEALALLDAGVDAQQVPEPGARDQRSLPLLAALLTDLRLLRALIAAGVDLNRAHAGMTALLGATRDSYHGRTDAVMTLLTNGADPRVVDAEGRSALHGAALSADPAVAALLIDAGAPLDAIDRAGWSPLGVACANGNWSLARFLLERGARAEPEGGQPVLLAACSGEDQTDGVRLLLKHKARVEARGRLNRSALHVACLAGNASIAAALLDAGADVNARDEHGVTPLLEAARAGSRDVLGVLAPRQPDCGASDASGRNALAIACQSSRCDSDLVAQLLAMGVDPQQACGDGRRPIDYAIAAGRWSLVARLDPAYPLPACVADSPDELADVPPLARLRVALEARRHDHIRELLPLLSDAANEIADLVVDLAARIDAKALRLLLPACEQVVDATGDGLAFRLLARGPDACGTLRVLLERGAAVSGRGGLARYLAHRSDGDGSGEAMAIELIARGADAFGADTDSAQPLLLAVRRDWAQAVAALLAVGVDPELRDARGQTPLLCACALGQEAMVRLLVAHGAQPATRAPDGQTALGLALSSGRRELSRWLDWPGWPLPRRALRDTDLPAAAQAGDADAVARLLDLGLPVQAQDAQGCTALLRAAGGGHLALVELLLARGADHSMAARSGATPLSAALSMRHDAVLQRLLDGGARPDQALPGDITPLMVAAALGQSRGVQLLLAHGADARCVDSEGSTALHAAAQFGFAARERSRAIALWDALLGAGGDIDAVNAAGQTPLLLLLGARAEAGAGCDEDVVLAQVDRLLARGATLSAQERRGFGALHLAALHGLARVVRALLAAGADPDLRDSINRRPQELALMRGFVDIASEFQPPRAAPSIARFLKPGVGGRES
jgi:ankyrin repeat protein